MPLSARSICTAPSAARTAVASYLLNLATYLISFHRPPGAAEAFVIQRMLVMLICPLSSSYTSLYYLITYFARIAAGELSLKQVLRTMLKVELPKSFQDAVSAGAIAILIPTRFHEVAISHYWYQAEFGTIVLKMDLEELNQDSDVRKSIFLLKTQHRIRGATARRSLYPSSNLLPQAIAAIQLLYSVWTYFDLYNASLASSGLSSPFVTTLPYAVMSFINLVTNMFIPTYSNIFALTPARYDSCSAWTEWEQCADFVADLPRPVNADPPDPEASTSADVAVSTGSEDGVGNRNDSNSSRDNLGLTASPTVDGEIELATLSQELDVTEAQPVALNRDATLSGQEGDPQASHDAEIIVGNHDIQRGDLTASNAGLSPDASGLRRRTAVAASVQVEYEPEGDRIKQDGHELYTWLSEAYPDIDFENATFTKLRRIYHPRFWKVASFVQENDVLFLIPVVVGMLIPQRMHIYTGWSNNHVWILLWIFGGAVVEAGDDIIMAYSAKMRRWRRNLRERTTIAYAGFDTNLPGMFKRLLQIIFFTGGLAVVLKRVYAEGC